jgi:hypothetical protein
MSSLEGVHGAAPARYGEISAKTNIPKASLHRYLTGGLAEQERQ